jgi:hypothetical protein
MHKLEMATIMSSVTTDVIFEPDALKAYIRNEAAMKLKLKNTDQARSFWCEADVSVNSPLSLAPDTELGIGKMRVGILKPGSSIEKSIKLYTRPNNFPDQYGIKITVFLYDEDGAIAEREDKLITIPCIEQRVSQG